MSKATPEELERLAAFAKELDALLQKYDLKIDTPGHDSIEAHYLKWLLLRGHDQV